MFRTRNLAVVATFVSAGALGAAVAMFDTSMFGGNQLAALGLTVQDEEQTFSAVLPEREGKFNFDERVLELRDKIAGRLLPDSDTEANDSEQATSTGENAEENTENEESPIIALTEKRCSLYQTSNSLWDGRGVKMQISEGARVFYRNGTATVVASTTVPSREILAELPLRKNATGTYCIPTDVIGITENGYLIHNNDVGLFSSYEANTIVGYALDGFPIYGTSEAKTDDCGGVVIGGQYRYILNPNQETIITCYAGTPIAL